MEMSRKVATRKKIRKRFYTGDNNNRDFLQNFLYCMNEKLGLKMYSTVQVQYGVFEQFHINILISDWLLTIK